MIADGWLVCLAGWEYERQCGCGDDGAEARQGQEARTWKEVFVCLQ